VSLFARAPQRAILHAPSYSWFASCITGYIIWNNFMLATSIHKRLLENLSTAVLLLDENLRAVFMNPAAEMLLEASGKRVKAAAVEELFSEEPSALPELQEALDSGHPYTKREAEFSLHSGSRIRVDYTVTPISTLKSPSLLIEIQPRDRLLRISREEDLLSKQETSRILVRGLAHEIKNPLGGIRGAAQLLDRELREARLHDYTQIIIEEADRLRNLVDRMLGPNKVFRLDPTNIHEVIERVAILIGAECEDRIELVRDYDPSIPEFPGEKEQLIQAFLNITRNAMQALDQQKDRGAKGRITFRTRALRQFTIGHTRHRLAVRVDIVDNGPGIPEEFQKNIFYPMVSGRADGTGLGLSITQSIIGQHQGLVECESTPGNTTFIVFIPLERRTR
jgi:two-component system, NtrC family, nitrogen regulation sensor histidine kinase GlnL